MKWQVQRTERIEQRTGTAQRLTDLSLAMILPWRDGFPQWWLPRDGSQDDERVQEIIDVTASERLPWQL